MSNTLREDEQRVRPASDNRNGTPAPAHAPAPRPAPAPMPVDVRSTSAPKAVLTPKPGRQTTGPGLARRAATQVGGYAVKALSVAVGGIGIGAHKLGRSLKPATDRVIKFVPPQHRKAALGLLVFLLLIPLAVIAGRSRPPGQTGEPLNSLAGAGGTGGTGGAGGGSALDANLEMLRHTRQPEQAGQGTNLVPFAAEPQRTTQTPPPAKGIADGQPRPKLARGKSDSREKGQRYYVLATYSVNKEEYLTPLLEYLWSQGVEAGAFNAHNSGFFQVIALSGFTREEINKGAHKSFEDRLRLIGTQWKKISGGDDSLKGLYLAEHKGAPLNVSITKASTP